MNMFMKKYEVTVKRTYVIEARSRGDAEVIASSWAKPLSEEVTIKEVRDKRGQNE